MSAVTLSLPYGAQEIAAMRAIGKRPSDMILVSFAGPLRETNPVVIAKQERTYDWRFLVGLDVLLVANSRTDRAAIRRTLDALQALPTEYLGLWLADRQNGVNVALGRWRFRPGALRSMTIYERGLYAGIGGDESCR